MKKLILAAAAVLLPAFAHAGAVLVIATDNYWKAPRLADNTKLWNEEAGNTVTVVSEIPTSLAGYDAIWDERFNRELTAAEQVKYVDFLSTGGGLYLLGETIDAPAEVQYRLRDESITSLIDLAGGGSVGLVDCAWSADTVQNVHAPFTGPNSVFSIDYASPACFDGTGNGELITSSINDPSIGSGLLFDIAGGGFLVALLDTDFLEGYHATHDYPNTENLARNLINFPRESTSIPEPSVLALLGIGLVGLSSMRRRQNKV